MQNKSLAHALFDSNSRSILTWKTRLSICLGIARGLEYLHGHPTLKIVHPNIKATNILLDSNFEAKISNFVLASLYAEEDFLRKEASQGYMAPEYLHSNVTQKADVYSYGVVVLEIVSGKKNVVSKSNPETEFLLDRAYKCHQEGRLLDLADKSLHSYDTKQALTLLNLAVKCTSVSPTLRPTMSEVVSILLGEKTIDMFYGLPVRDKTKGSGDVSKVDEEEVEEADLEDFYGYDLGELEGFSGLSYEDLLYGSDIDEFSGLSYEDLLYGSDIDEM
ncbi:hypothetical protein CerSpe_148880 [Prunus speciosa]